MKVNKARNHFLILKIVLLTFMMIGCFSVVFISTMFLFIDGFSVLIILGIIAGILLGYWSIKMMIKLNKGWMTNMVEEIRSGEIENSLVWKFSKEEWSAFIQWRKKTDRGDLKGSIIMTSIIAIVIFFAVMYSSLEILPLVGVSLGAGVAFGTLIGLLMFWGNVMITKKMNASPDGKIIFTENAFLINDLLIFFNQMGTSLKKMKIVEYDFGLLIHAVVATQAGTRKNEKEHTFPIPADRELEAEKLVELYGFSSEHEKADGSAEEVVTDQ